MLAGRILTGAQVCNRQLHKDPQPECAMVYILLYTHALFSVRLLHDDVAFAKQRELCDHAPGQRTDSVGSFPEFL